MTDIKIGGEVRVLPVGMIRNRDAPRDGWPGKIVKVTPKQVHIEYGELPRTDVFDRASQWAVIREIGRKFRTLPQFAEDNRRSAALVTLRDAKIRVDPRDFTLEQIESLAEVVKTWDREG
jgi:hypothetical protein